MFVEIKFIESTTKEDKVLYVESLHVKNHLEMHSLSLPRVGDVVSDATQAKTYKVKKVEHTYNDFATVKGALELKGVYVYLKPIKTRVR